MAFHEIVLFILPVFELVNNLEDNTTIENILLNVIKKIIMYDT